MNGLLRILAVTHKPDSGSFDQRVRHYIEPLRQRGIEVSWRQLPNGTVAQWRFLAAAGEFDAVWWHRQLLSPFGVVQRLRRRARRLVFDYDDPLIYSGRQGGHVSFARRIKFAAMLRRADLALTSSEYLAEIGRRWCDNVHIMPMAVDIADEPPAARPSNGLVELLWLGSRSTQHYLELIRPALEQLGAEAMPVRLRLVAHEAMRFGQLDVDFRPWSASEQEAALDQCHIGLCPMPDTPWTRGKCPYKVLQYMAAAMPWIGSAVGENTHIAGEQTNDVGPGIAADDANAWGAALRQLIADRALRESMGRRGRDYARQHHDRDVLADQLAALWFKVTGSRAIDHSSAHE